MTLRRATVLWLACGLAPWLILVAVNRLGPTLHREATVHLAHQCSWACHNHKEGCVHDEREPVLPNSLTGDDGLFGATIRALQRTGQYRIANILLFCVLWPGLMWGLLGIGLCQRALIYRQRAWRAALLEDSQGTGCAQ